MPARRSSSRVALFAALAVVGSPSFSRGQNAASLEIDRALFMVATKGPDGKWAVRETDRVPLRPRDACYGWRLHFSNNAPGEVAWRGEFTLPATPGKDPTLLVTKKSEKPLGGWIGDGWCVTKGDPTGEHVIKVYVRDSLARTFRFSVVAPDRSAGPIRAATLKGDVVMFHTLEPGNYSLRFIRVENYNPWQFLALEKPPFIEINVTVPGSGIAYLGTVMVSKKLRLGGSKPPEFQLTYDKGRELQAWSAFKEKYAESPWAALAEQRIVALRSA